MLKALFGSKDKELVLQYLLSKQEGYASKIARFYNLKPSQILKQLEALEDGDVLVGFQVGRTRLYKFNPRYYFYPELEALLKKSRDTYPDELKEKLLFSRTAPRKKNKKYILKGDIVETEL
jgi:predicted transcriptional regulator